MERQTFESTFFQAFLTAFSVTLFSFIFMELCSLPDALPTAPATVFALVVSCSLVLLFKEIALSILIGLAMGWLFVFLAAKINDQSICGVCLLLFLVLLLVLSEYLMISPMLSAMILGFMAIDFNGFREETTEEIARAEDLVFFFVTAGVAIAFVHMTSRIFPEISGPITAIVLASIMLNELIGPLGVELALFRSGEARGVRK